MRLYLLRHGTAEGASADGADESRRLTDEGHVELKRVLALARDAGVAEPLILSSPLVRAVQSAEVAARILGSRGSVVRTSALEPDSSPEAIWSEIRSRRKEPSLLLAGHEPLMSAAAGFLLGDPQLLIKFRKAALMRIDLEEFTGEPHGVLQWMITPKLAGVR